MKSLKKKISYCIYRIIRWFVWVFYPKTTPVGVENLPTEPCLIVGNHTQMNGPIVCELYFPIPRKTWCAGQMMRAKEVPAYAFCDFWSRKPKWCRWFYKILSYIIAPFSACVFTNAQTIPVYKDSRVIGTFKQTVTTLKEGVSVVVFPEQDAPYNHILCDFQDKFIDIARLYYKQTGKALPFVPMYIAPKLKKFYFGEPVSYDPDKPMEQQRQQIKETLMERITDLAVNLPRHKVVRYRNEYGTENSWNIPAGGAEYETARR